MEETIVYKAFCRWRNRLKDHYYRYKGFTNKNDLPTGEGYVYDGPMVDREDEWTDYICLRDRINYRSSEKVKPELTGEQYAYIKSRVTKDLMN